MSGGHFDYNQYRLDDIAYQIDRLVKNNNTENEVGNCCNYSDDIIEKFKLTSRQLKQTANMVQRIDWLVCGDDGEETFEQKWKEEVEDDES